MRPGVWNCGFHFTATISSAFFPPPLLYFFEKRRLFVYYLSSMKCWRLRLWSLSSSNIKVYLILRWFKHCCIGETLEMAVFPPPPTFFFFLLGGIKTVLIFTTLIQGCKSILFVSGEYSRCLSRLLHVLPCPLSSYLSIPCHGICHCVVLQ